MFKIGHSWLRSRQYMIFLPFTEGFTLYRFFYPFVTLNKWIILCKFLPPTVYSFDDFKLVIILLNTFFFLDSNLSKLLLSRLSNFYYHTKNKNHSVFLSIILFTYSLMFFFCFHLPYAFALSIKKSVANFYSS